MTIRINPKMFALSDLNTSKFDYNLVNSMIGEFVTHQKEMGVTPLGPQYSRSNLNIHDVASQLALHRMVGKFEEPVVSVDTLRKQLTIDKMVEYDMHGLHGFDPSKLELTAYERLNLFNIRKELNEVLSHYYLDDSRLEFPSGETYVSARGDTDLYAKCRDIKQLVVTNNCFDIFARIAYKSPILKFTINRHFKNKYNVSSYTYKRAWASLIKEGHSVKKAAFLIFKEKLRGVATIVSDARITTVPKNLESDRVIECEALCNMIVQRTIAAAIKKLILKRYGIDLNESQIVHKRLIELADNATIDLKNASNSVFYSVVTWLMGGTKLWKDLTASRCGTVLLPDGSRLKLSMLSPMGNGFTFEVMTLILLAFTRYFDSFSHVFGDDIIVHVDVAGDVIRMLELIGFKTNKTKTFLTGHFRESCGGFTFKGEHLTSFDFHWAENAAEAVILINKVFLLSRNALIGKSLRIRLLKLHAKLLSVVPQAMLRGVNGGTNFALSVVSEQSELLQHKHNPWRIVLWEAHNIHGNLDLIRNTIPSLEEGVWIERFLLLKIMGSSMKKKRFEQRDRLQSTSICDTSKPSTTTQLCWEREQIDAYYHVYVESDCYRFRNGRKMKPIDNVSNLLAWTYIAKGRICAPILSSTTVKGHWVITPTPLI